MMNDLAEAMREAAEILHEIGGYSALVDDLRYGAAELEGDAERCKHGIRLPHECGECQNSVDTEAAVAWYAYESVAAILEPHMGRNGRDGILPASVTDAVQILLEHRLRHPPTERAVPEGYVMLPAKLTAENGAKSALMGEFHERIETECPECEGGLHDNDDGCAECGGEWVVYDKMPVSWDTIKRIHEAVVQHFAAAPGAGGES